MSTSPNPRQQFTHKKAVRAGMASFMGTTIEFYDFYVYATAAAIVFGPLFFPDADPILGVLYSFATYAVGFFFRPLGAVLFGHIGDRHGRRVSLVLTLVLMGVATTLVGLLPTYETAGALAPVLLIILRAMQGLAVGGEWGGAVLMSTESAPEKFKGFYGAFPQLGNPMGALLASLIFSALTVNGNEFLLNGGWRIPFLLSVVLIGIGFWVRYRVEETPVFQEEAAVDPAAHRELPLKLAIRRNWKAMLLGMGLIPVSTGGYYIVTTFATSYGTEPAFGIGISEHLMLNILSVAALGELVSTLFIGVMADRIGRKKTMGAALVLTSVLVMPMFLSMSPENPLLMFVLFTAFRIAMNGTWAPLASIMSQMFDAESRQSALSVSYGLGNAIWAGLSPVVATALFAATGTIWSVILLYMGMATLSMVCLVLAPQIRDNVFDVDHETPAAATVAR
ncbi:MFS transporter [Micrococcus luteus]|uniref:MFS transporter n=3 Tax=Micrococcaceae TaxID=1268 RepID=UPI000C7BFD19|nr:MFS transporter [Micrococcus luteus]MCT1856110.1 MHS family MFS transporter [Micrococcus luteus]MCV7726729.1 MHS family MFS transporter [Micrococcus luteus]MDK7330341.1 MFS transporter [Micrococcus luteus]PLA41652.1 MFS transporter [Micrococcus luteus]